MVAVQPQPLAEAMVAVQRPPLVEAMVAVQRPPLVEAMVAVQRPPLVEAVVVAQRQPQAVEAAAVVAQRQPQAAVVAMALLVAAERDMGQEHLYHLCLAPRKTRGRTFLVAKSNQHVTRLSPGSLA
jgi:hypothetical protein